MMRMKKFLLHAALSLLAGGWCLTASAAWDLTQKPDPITKISEIEDGHVYYFRNVCHATAAQKVLAADFTYKNTEVTEKNLFRVVFGEINPLTGTQMIYTQNVGNGMWFSGSTAGWTIATMEESTPFTVNQASVTTSMEMKNPADPSTNVGMTVAEWYAAGGDDTQEDINIFATDGKIQAWKWRQSQLDQPGGDALTFGEYESDYTEGALDKVTFMSQVWGWDSYPDCWWSGGPTAINPWYLYEAVEVYDPIADLETLYNQYQSEDLSHMYPAGTAPGQYNLDLVNAFYSKYREVTEALDFENYVDLTNDIALKLTEELKAARAALDASEVAPMHEGYFYIPNGYWAFEQQQKYTFVEADGTTVEIGKTKAMYDVESSSSLGRWGNLYSEIKDADNNLIGVELTRDRAYMFKITKDKNNPELWNIQNVKTGRYLVAGDAPSSTEVAAQEIIYQGYGVFGIYPENGTDSYDFFHASGHNSGAGASGNLTTWSMGVPGASTWYFLEILEPELLDSISRELTQNVLETAMNNNLETANSLYNAGFNSLITDAAQLSSNAVEPSEGSLANLIDGDNTTFFHSQWSGTGPDEDHYLQVKLNESVSKVGIYWHKRTQNHANRPSKITVYGSNDGATWAQAGILPAEGDTLPWGSSTPEYKTELTFNPAASYTYLKFEVNEAKTAAGAVNGAVNNGHPYFTFGEFQLYPAMNADSTFQYASSSFGYREDLKQSYADLKAAIDLAQSKVGEVTQPDIDALAAAIEAFEAIYPDTTLLGDVLTRAQTYYDEASPDAGDGAFGTYKTPAVHEALLAAINTAKEGYDRNTATRADIDKRRADLLVAVDNFLADINMPETDTWYVIENRYNGTDREDSNPSGLAVYASSTGVGSGIVWGGTYDINASADPSYLWRFLDLGDGTVAVQNLGSGYYMGAHRGTSAQYLLSDTVVPFKIVYVAGEQLSLQDASVSEDNAYRFTHAAASGSAVVSWSASKDSPSAWTFREMDENTFYDFRNLPAGGMDVRCFPYVTASTGSLSDSYGNPITPYELASAKRDAEGNVTEITLNPMDIPAGGIPAGTPYITAQPEEAQTDDGQVPVNFAIDLNGEISTEAQTINGLVGVFTGGSAAVGCGYFQGDSYEITVVKGQATSIGSQTGYINPKYITEDKPAVDGNITVKIAGDGVLNAIKDAITDANTIVTVTSVDGVVVRQNVKASEALKGLPKGVYIVGGKKVSVK